MESRAAEKSVFTAQETHGRALRPGNRLLSHSQDAGWRPLHAAIFEETPFHATESAIGHPSLIFHLSRPTTVSRRVEGEHREKALIRPRQFCLTPGESNTAWEHSGHPEILQVYLRCSVFRQAVEEMFGVDGHKADVVPQFAFTDPLLEQLAVAIISALRFGSSEDRLYIESIAQMIAVHLARQHSTRTARRKSDDSCNLSRPTIRRLVDYIDAHLGDDLSLDTMATEVGLNAFQLSRAFKGELGQPPHQYVLAQRIERAKDLLCNTESPIADIALAVGFSSQSHLSSCFRRVVGVSPGAFRRIH